MFELRLQEDRRFLPMTRAADHFQEALSVTNPFSVSALAIMHQPRRAAVDIGVWEDLFPLASAKGSRHNYRFQARSVNPGLVPSAYRAQPWSSFVAA